MNVLYNYTYFIKVNNSNNNITMSLFLIYHQYIFLFIEVFEKFFAPKSHQGFDGLELQVSLLLVSECALCSVHFVQLSLG